MWVIHEESLQKYFFSLCHADIAMVIPTEPAMLSLSYTKKAHINT